MITSTSGINLIKQFESLRLKAYQDSVGIWTIGYGTIMYPDGTRVKAGDTCNQAQAIDYLQYKLTQFEKTINSVVKVKLTQNQFDSLVSFVYNVGETNFKSSTLLKKLNVGDYKGASQEFPKWNIANHQVLNGLTKRRLAEQKLFLS